MKLSSKGRYGVRALFDIAFHNDGRPTQIRDIADREAIPARFLEQIFQDLKRAGLVSAKRGPRGGYRLARPAPDIRVGDVLRALEGPIAIAAQVDRGRRRRADGAVESHEVTDAVFRELSARIEGCFDAVTIADICARGEALGLRRHGRETFAYVI